MSKLLTTIRDLSRRKAREKRGLALAEGVRLVEEALAAGVTITGAAVAPTLEATERGRALKGALEKRGVPLETLEDRALTELADTEHPQGIVAVIRAPSWHLDDLVEFVPPVGAPAVLVVLDGVQDPGNVGTIMRTSLALGAKGLIALPGTVDLLNSKVLRASMGACFTLPHCEATVEDVLAMSADPHLPIPLWAADGGGMDIRSVAIPSHPIALVFGNEGAGVTSAISVAASKSVAIPFQWPVESLNVATAVAVLLWETQRGWSKGSGLMRGSSVEP